MRTHELSPTLDTLFSELTLGAPDDEAFILNPLDPGLLGSLAALSAADASRSLSGGATVAAHANHLRYGLSLLNRWAAGEDPFRDTDWAGSWKLEAVSEPEWSRLRAALGDEVRRWRDALRTPREVQPAELHGMVASIAHVAYHLGAIRQIQPAARGPRAE